MTTSSSPRFKMSSPQPVPNEDVAMQGIEGLTDKESSTTKNDSEEMVTGRRVIRLVMYGRIPLDDSHRIWVQNKATYGDIETGLSKLDPGGSFSVLQPVWVPIPRWVWADSDSHIGVTCQNLYVVKRQASRYVVATVRTRLSDYPVIVSEPEDLSVTISQAVTQTNTNLTGPFWAITHYSDERDVKDDRFDYHELVSYCSSNFPTALVIVVDEPSDEFLSNIPYNPPPFVLQMSLSSCRDILKRAYGAKSFALQTIHLARGLRHLIITLANDMREVYVDEGSNIDAALATNDKLADLLSVVPSLTDELDMLIESVRHVLEVTESGNLGNFSTAAVKNEIKRLFHALCGEFPGAVAIRHSNKRFEKLAKLDEEDASDRPSVVPGGAGIHNSLREENTLTVPYSDVNNDWTNSEISSGSSHSEAASLENETRQHLITSTLAYKSSDIPLRRDTPSNQNASPAVQMPLGLLPSPVRQIGSPRNGESLDESNTPSHTRYGAISSTHPLPLQQNDHHKKSAKQKFDDAILLDPESVVHDANSDQRIRSLPDYLESIVRFHSGGSKEQQLSVLDALLFNQRTDQPICDIERKQGGQGGIISISCLLCSSGKVFERSNILSRFADHLIPMHLGLQLYFSCSSCGKSYNHRQSRDRHEQRVHNLFRPKAYEGLRKQALAYEVDVSYQDAGVSYQYDEVD